jgi:hypothetical protein
MKKNPFQFSDEIGETYETNPIIFKNGISNMAIGIKMIKLSEKDNII